MYFPSGLASSPQIAVGRCGSVFVQVDESSFNPCIPRNLFESLQTVSMCFLGRGIPERQEGRLKCDRMLTFDEFVDLRPNKFKKNLFGVEISGFGADLSLDEATIIGGGVDPSFSSFSGDGQRLLSCGGTDPDGGGPDGIGFGEKD